MVSDVTLLSVVSGDDAALLWLNFAHTEFVNSRDAGDSGDSANMPKWLVVDNRDHVAGAAPPWPGPLPPYVEVVPGAARVVASDAGSRHHADGLHRGLERVTTRFVQILDPDFYVLQPRWLARTVEYAKMRNLALFGSVWHPRWTSQFRNFPSIHYLLIDGSRVPLDGIDLRPRIDGDWWWRLISDDRKPVPFRAALKHGRIRDTGWELYRKYRHDAGVRRELLVPHWPGPARWTGKLLLRAQAALGARLPRVPAFATTITTRQSFLARDFPDDYAAGWEEFYWQGRPFGFHLRRIGRRRKGAATMSDGDRVAAVLAAYLERPPL